MHWSKLKWSKATKRARIQSNATHTTQAKEKKVNVAITLPWFVPLGALVLGMIFWDIYWTAIADDARAAAHFAKTGIRQRFTWVLYLIVFVLLAYAVLK